MYKRERKGKERKKEKERWKRGKGKGRRAREGMGGERKGKEGKGFLFFFIFLLLIGFSVFLEFLEVGGDGGDEVAGTEGEEHYRYDDALPLFVRKRAAYANSE